MPVAVCGRLRVRALGEGGARRGGARLRLVVEASAERGRVVLSVQEERLPREDRPPGVLAADGTNSEGEVAADCEDSHGGLLVAELAAWAAWLYAQAPDGCV